MSDRNIFSHVISGMKSFTARITSRVGPTNAMSENIAQGQKSIKESFDAFNNSPSHKVNMIGKNYKCYGVARYGPKNYWTQEFAGSGCQCQGMCHELLRVTTSVAIALGVITEALGVSVMTVVNITSDSGHALVLLSTHICEKTFCL